MEPVRLILLSERLELAQLFLIVGPLPAFVTDIWGAPSSLQARRELVAAAAPTVQANVRVHLTAVAYIVIMGVASFRLWSVAQERGSTLRKRVQDAVFAGPRIQEPLLTSPALVTVAVFSDYACFGCRALFLQVGGGLRNLEKRHPRLIRSVSLDLPLDRECNSYLQRTVHAKACAAAVAGRLGRSFADSVDTDLWLFNLQSRFGIELERELDSRGLHASFRRDYTRLLDAVRSDVHLAERLGVQSTPAAFVNGVRVPAVSGETLRLAVNLELERHGSSIRLP